MTASGPWKAPSPGRRVSHLAPPGAAASTRPTAGRMVDHQEIQRGARSCFPGPAECGQNSPSRSGSKTGRLSNRASGGILPPEARLFLSVAKCMAKRKSGNLNRPKLLYIAREKTAFQLKSGLFFWSCWADSNRRPHPYQATLELFSNYFSCFMAISAPIRLLSATL